MIEGIDLEMGKLPGFVQVDPVLYEPLKIKESFLAATTKGQKDAISLALRLEGRSQEPMMSRL